MTLLRTGATSISPGEDKTPPPDPIEVGARARENAVAYAAWVNAGKTREVLEAEQRQHHRRRATSLSPDDVDG